MKVCFVKLVGRELAWELIWDNNPECDFGRTWIMVKNKIYLYTKFRFYFLFLLFLQYLWNNLFTLKGILCYKRFFTWFLVAYYLTNFLLVRMILCISYCNCLTRSLSLIFSSVLSLNNWNSNLQEFFVFV